MDIPIQGDLDVIVKKINDILPEAQVYLFGSYAAGTQRHDSDIDLCVVVPKFEVTQMQTIHSIRDAINDLTRLPIDILAFRKNDFEERAKFRSTIQFTIVNKGVLLYG